MTIETIYERDDNPDARELKLIIWPDNRLNIPCETITRFDDSENHYLERLVVDMSFTMLNRKGIGLAAPQVGILANLAVLSIDATPYVLVNPQVINASTEMMSFDEGCLSAPGYYDVRERPNWIVVKHQTICGDEKEVEFHGLWAFAVQHEIDHLNGKLFLDGLSRFKQARIKNKIKKTLKTQ